MVKTTPVPLYRNLKGKSLFDSDDPRFKEYRTLWHSRPQTFDAGDFPLFLDIEVTNNCNFRCTFCATTYFPPEVKRGFIDPALVRKILREGRDNGLYGVKFNDRGEPLLHPDLPEFVAYAKKMGLVDVYFNTNASLLTREKSRALIEAGLDRISISVEGTSAPLYERYRKGGNFERLVQNIEGLLEERSRLGSSTPKLRIQSVLIPEVQEMVEEYGNFWSQYADEVSTLDYKEETNADERERNAVFDWACPQLWQRMVIWFDGTIFACNENDGGEMALGNAHDMSIAQAWKSEQLERLRELHKAGRSHECAGCDGCYLRDCQMRLANG